MPVYFAYRSFDHGPTGKFLRRFDDDTVLAWFQRHWFDLAIEDSDRSDERLTELLGCDGWFLFNPFPLAARQNLPRPKTDADLLDVLSACLGGTEYTITPHSLQVFTEEDGEGGAVFYFDGHFLAESAGLASYLLHEDWRLPTGVGDGRFVPTVSTTPLPSGSGPGTTYVVILDRESKYPLDDLTGGYRIEGIRLPDLARHLCPPGGLDVAVWSGYLCRLPALLLAEEAANDPMEEAFRRAVRDDPQDAVNWAAWSDWWQDRDKLPLGIDLLDGALRRFARVPGKVQDRLPMDQDLSVACQRLRELEADRSRLRSTAHSLFHAEEHLVQACLDVSWDEEPYFSQWMFFDDLWASAHPDLANAILRFSLRWNVLSPDE